MKFVTAAQMRELDRLAIEEFGIPSIVLMENAGIAVANEVVRMLGKPLKLKAVSQAVIFSGKGNNGGDGFVAARHLANQGFKAVVVYFQKPSQMKPDALTNFEILEKLDISLVSCTNSQLDKTAVKKILQGSSVVIDALFGTGLSKPIEEPFETAIELMNESKLPIVAADIPSGMNADTGEIMGSCVRAKTTVTFGLPKKGFKFKMARRYLGDVIVADISMPKVLL